MHVFCAHILYARGHERKYVEIRGSYKELVRDGEGVCLTSYLQLAEVCADTPPLAEKQERKGDLELQKLNPREPQMMVPCFSFEHEQYKDGKPLPRSGSVINGTHKPRDF